MNKLIIASTPLRISLVGGGKDFKEFYLKEKNYGQVISTAININTYCFLKKKNIDIENKKDSFFSNKILNTEIYDSFKKYCIQENISDEFDLMLYSDIPSGSGLGSSSSFILSILKAFNKFKNTNIDDKKLINTANYFESKLMGRTIGMQDAWGCQISGLKKITFKKNITIKKINNKKLTYFINNKLFLYPIKQFKSNQNILSKIQKNIKSKKNFNTLKQMNLLTEKAYQFISKNDFSSLLSVLRDSHDLKSNYALGVENQNIKNAFKKLENLNLRPLKILGAGGRGYVLFYSDTKNKLENTKIEYLDFKII